MPRFLKWCLYMLIPILILGSVFYGIAWFGLDKQIQSLRQEIQQAQEVGKLLRASQVNLHDYQAQWNPMEQLSEQEILKTMLEDQKKQNQVAFGMLQKSSIEQQIQLKERIAQASVHGIKAKTELKEIAALDLFSPENAKKLSETILIQDRINKELDTGIQDYITQKQAKNEFVNPLWFKTDRQLADLIAQMPVEDKAGQLLLFAAQGQSMNSSYDGYLKNLKPNGLIFMGDNIGGQTRVTDFIKEAQKTNTQIPLFIAVDQEGGVVKRISWDPTEGQTNWSKKSDEEICSQAKTRAQVLKDAGFNLNFAPVVDLTNPSKGAFINNRTISIAPDLTTQKAKQFVTCHQQVGPFTTLKHFPGHGPTTEDSHVTLPVITKSKDDWLQTDAIPFKSLQDSKFIMVGHLVFKALDDKPATQSSKVLQDVLRKELGYQGLLITDAMGQLHTSTNISVRDALKNAYNAGINIVLYVSLPYGNDEAGIKSTLVDLINKGEISKEQIDQSLKFILQTKRIIQ